MRKTKAISIDKLKKKAWAIFSEYIRKLEGKCFTCGAINDWREDNAGHFVHGSTTPIYLSEKNVHAQCIKCNMYLSGNLDIYALLLIRKYGQGIIEELVSQKYMIKYWKIKELQDFIKEYQDKLSKL